MRNLIETPRTDVAHLFCLNEIHTWYIGSESSFKIGKAGRYVSFEISNRLGMRFSTAENLSRLSGSILQLFRGPYLNFHGPSTIR